MWRALWEMGRPVNMALGSCSALAGALLAGGGAALARPSSWLAAISTALALAAGNAWNDLADVREDQVNRPTRPLPSGRLTPLAARQAAAVAALGALACALWVGTASFLWVATCLALLGWYARRGKNEVLLGNAVVAFLSIAAVGLGAYHASLDLPHADPSRVGVPAAMAGLLHMMRELVKDAEDMAGDRVAGRRSLALVHGLEPLARLLGQLSVLAFLPPLLALWLSREHPDLRWAHALALGLSPALWWRVRGTALDSPREAARLSRFIKILLGLGLGLYVLAAL